MVTFIFGLLSGILFGFLTAALFSVSRDYRGRFSDFSDAELIMLKKQAVASSVALFASVPVKNINYESEEWKNHRTFIQEINDEIVFREQKKRS